MSGEDSLKPPDPEEASPRLAQEENGGLQNEPPMSESCGLSRNPSLSGSSSHHDEWDPLPPLERLTVLDLLDNFALPLQLEKLQKGISAHTQKVRRSRDALKTRSQVAKDRMVEEWRRRVPPAEVQLERYRRSMKLSVEKLGSRWNDTKVITAREKFSFICGVMNIFISGYLLGGHPELFHVWYGILLIYFLPLRGVLYFRRGYQYFLADLCYVVNVLVALSLWVFPRSRRLFLAAYCLAFGNNAIAILMWRNSLVFHSFDKVTSLFIHIMPCAALHCVVHLYPLGQQALRFPAVFAIINPTPGSPAAYGSLLSMLAWSSLPYAMWQLSYYFFITVRRREKIAAGRPTSFTWMRRSYAKTWLGKLLLSLPEALQEPAFMLIQYNYAVLTMLPCPIWLHHRSASGAFLMVLFTWSVYNGSTYYIDVFGKRFQKELESMKAEVAKWQHNSELSPSTSPEEPSHDGALGGPGVALAEAEAVVSGDKPGTAEKPDPADRVLAVDDIPLLDEEVPAFTSGVDQAAQGGSRESKVHAS